MNDLLQEIRGKFFDYRGNRGNRETVWNDNYKAYMSDSDDEYFVPETFTDVNTLLPPLVGPLTNTKKGFIKVLGRNQDDHQKAQVVQDLLNYQFNNCNARQKIRQVYLEAIIYGTAVIRPYYKYLTHSYDVEVPIIDNIGNVIEYDTIKEEEVIFDDPDFEIVSIYDFYFDYTAGNFNGMNSESARDCIERRFMSKEEIQRLADVGYYDSEMVEQLFDEMPSGGDAVEEQHKQQDLNETEYRKQEGTSSVDQKYELWEYWTPDLFVVVAAGKYIIKNDINPNDGFLPYEVITFVNVPHQVYGRGAPEIISSLQEMINKVASQKYKNIRMTNEPCWLTKAGALIDGENIELEAGQIIAVNHERPEMAMIPIRPPDVSQSAFAIQLEMQRMAQNALATTDYIQGQTSSLKGSQTATEVAYKTQQAQNRFKLIFEHMAESIIQVAKFFLILTRNNVSEEKIIRVLDKDDKVSFEKIQPLDLTLKYDIILSVEPLETTESEKRESLLMILGLVSQNPMLMQVFDPVSIASTLFETMGINLEEISRRQNGQGQQMLNGFGGVGGMGTPLQAPMQAGGVPQNGSANMPFG